MYQEQGGSEGGKDIVPGTGRGGSCTRNWKGRENTVKVIGSKGREEEVKDTVAETGCNGREGRILILYVC